MATYNKRKTDYQKAHGFTEEMLNSFIETFQLKKGETFLDLMGGSGIVSKKAIEMYGGSKSTRALLDAYSAQIDPFGSYKTVLNDARIAEIQTESYDVIAMKNAIHEIRKHQQGQIYRNANYFLKPKGRICLWEIACKTPREQKEFNEVIRKKDKLSGFKDLVEQRHFSSLSELINLLDDAGFKDIGIEKDMYFTINTRNWLDNDFGGDKKKLKEFNEFVRSNYEFEDHGTYLTKQFYWPVIVAHKE